MSGTDSKSHTLITSTRTLVESFGHRTLKGIEELGYATSLFFECFYWLLFGRQRRQAVRLSAIFVEAMNIGVRAALIASLLCFAVGIMLAIQGIETLKK